MTQPAPHTSPARASAKHAPKQSAQARRGSQVQPGSWHDGIAQLLRGSLHALRINPGPIIGIVLTPIVVSMPVFFLIITGLYAASTAPADGRGAHTLPPAMAVIILAAYVAMLLLCLAACAAYVAATLLAARGTRIRYGKAFKAGWKRLPALTILWLILLLATAAGLLLLVMPGIFIVRRYSLAPYYLLDRRLSIRDALRQAAQESRRQYAIWYALLLWAVAAAVVFVPHIGWLLACIFTMAALCAPAVCYMQASTAAGYVPESPAT